MVDPSEVGGETPIMGDSALSMYANGSGREGAVSKGSAHANGEAGGMAETAESECGERDESGVVPRVAQPVADEGEKVED
jgi:hypothetical protein